MNSSALACYVLGDRRTETLRALALYPDTVVADIALHVLLLRSETAQPRAVARARLGTAGDPLVEVLQLTITDPPLAFNRAVALWSGAANDDANGTAAVAAAIAARAAARMALFHTAQLWRNRARRTADSLPAHHAFDQHVTRQLLLDSALHLLAKHPASPRAAGWLHELTGLPTEQLTAWVPAAIEQRAVSILVQEGFVTSVQILGEGDVGQLSEFTRLALLQPLRNRKGAPPIRNPAQWEVTHRLLAERLGEKLFSNELLAAYVQSTKTVAVIPVGKFARICLSELAPAGHPLRERASLWTPVASTTAPTPGLGTTRLEVHARDAGTCPNGFNHIVGQPGQALTAPGGGVLLLHAHGAAAGGTGGISHAMTADDAAGVVLQLDDGPLSSAEAVNWPLKGWGVVLLACGAGAFRSGHHREQPLVAALLQARAEWVLASPWLLPISRDTNLVVEKFVAELAGGADPAGALAAAQLAACNRGQHRVTWQAWRLFA